MREMSARAESFGMGTVTRDAGKRTIGCGRGKRGREGGEEGAAMAMVDWGERRLSTWNHVVADD